MNTEAIRNVNIFPCAGTRTDSPQHWPDSDLLWLVQQGVRGLRVCWHIEWLLTPDYEPDAVGVAILVSAIERLVAKVGAQSITLGIHYGYGGWDFKSALLGGGSPMRQKIWRLYKLLSGKLPAYVQIECTPNEASGPDTFRAALSTPWHNWYQRYFLSAIRAGAPNRKVWLSPGSNWEIARLLNGDGDAWDSFTTAPKCGRIAHVYIGLNPGVNPTTFTLPEAELEGALMNGFIDLSRFCNDVGEDPFIGECFGFDFTKPMPDFKRALRYIDKFTYCAQQVGIPFSGFHADMLFGTLPGQRRPYDGSPFVGSVTQ